MQFGKNGGLLLHTITPTGERIRWNPSKRIGSNSKYPVSTGKKAYFLERFLLLTMVRFLHVNKWSESEKQ